MGISPNQLVEIRKICLALKDDFEKSSDFLESRTKQELLDILFDREEFWRMYISDLMELLFETQNASAKLIVDRILKNE